MFHFPVKAYLHLEAFTFTCTTLWTNFVQLCECELWDVLLTLLCMSIPVYVYLYTPSRNAQQCGNDNSHLEEHLNCLVALSYGQHVGGSGSWFNIPIWALIFTAQKGICGGVHEAYVSQAHTHVSVRIYIYKHMRSFYWYIFFMTK